MIEKPYVRSLMQYDRRWAQRDMMAGEYAAAISRHCPQLHQCYPDLSPEQIASALRTAGCLHDLGRMHVIHENQEKKTVLGAIGPDEIRSHPKRIVEILRSDPDFQSEPPSYRRLVENACLYHHERYNGTGYPCGMDRHSVPIEAYIIAISDVMESMLSSPFYKPQWVFESVVKRVCSGSRHEYSPAAVECFLNACPDLWHFSLR